MSVLSTDANGDVVRTTSDANDNIVYGLSINANNTTYGAVLFDGDGTNTGNMVSD